MKFKMKYLLVEFSLDCSLPAPMLYSVCSCSAAFFDDITVKIDSF